MRKLRAWIAEWCCVYTGSNRVVLDFFRLGFVFKFPIVHLKMFFQTVWFLVFEARICREWFGEVWGLFSRPTDFMGAPCLRMMFFKGIVHNWREFWFYLVERPAYAQSTYFSLFGLMNIQKKGILLRMEYGEFKKSIIHLIGEKAYYSDGHHFRNTDNFSVENGKLKFLDYGGLGTQKIIREYGAHLYNNFQPDKQD